MRLALEQLTTIHGELSRHPVYLAKCGGLAFQRAGHDSPVEMAVEHDGNPGRAEVAWPSQNLGSLAVLDDRDLTKWAAEAVALSYVNARGGWVIKRVMQQDESADWLLRAEARWLALEVSGTTTEAVHTRLAEKRTQVANCTLPAERLAVVVAFTKPLLAAATL